MFLYFIWSIDVKLLVYSQLSLTRSSSCYCKCALVQCFLVNVEQWTLKWLSIKCNNMQQLCVFIFVDFIKLVPSPAERWHNSRRSFSLQGFSFHCLSFAQEWASSWQWQRERCLWMMPRFRSPLCRSSSTASVLPTNACPALASSSQAPPVAACLSRPKPARACSPRCGMWCSLTMASR